jgi:uncharacterized protein YaiE (UPF0345 family)
MKQTNRAEFSYRTFKSGGHSRPPERDEWRCHCCGKLLGIPHGDEMHIKIKSCQEYLVAYPVTAKCRGCGTMNKLSAPRR